MYLPRKLTHISLALALALGTLSMPQKASAIGALSYSWSCYPPNGICDFTVTSNNHAQYRWTFGDGSSSGPNANTSVSHDYAVSAGGQNFTVTLIGYASGSSTPDNIISCTIEAQGPSPGGNPGGAGGTCSG